MVKTFKTRAYIVDDQTAAYIERAFGVRRWVWNWTLSRFKQEKEKTGRFPSWYALDKEIRREVKHKNDKGFEWLAEQLVSPYTWQECMKDLHQCFQQCREVQKDVDRRYRARLKSAKKRRKKNKHKKVQPKFKSRKDPKQTFSLYHSLDRTYRVEGEHTLSFSAGQMRGVLRTRESLAFLKNANVKMTKMTVKREGSELWLCISYERLNHTMQKPHASGKIGIDLGVVKSVVSFDGKETETVSFNTKRSMHLDRLSKKLNKKLSRQVQGSKRFERTRQLAAQRAARAARIRKDHLENYTTKLADNYDEIMIDDFHFRSAIEVADRDQLYRCMKFEFKLRLAQKCEERGTMFRLVEHRRGQKTTTKCSFCGSEKVSIVKGERIMKCRCCGAHLDRDENAAINSYKLL